MCGKSLGLSALTIFYPDLRLCLRSGFCTVKRLFRSTGLQFRSWQLTLSDKYDIQGIALREPSYALQKTTRNGRTHTMATFHNTFLDQATKQRWAVATILSFVCMVLSSPINASADDFPGTIIDYVPPETLSYVGCPSIAILPNGNYVASHSYFGGGTTNDQSVIFGSQDQGKTWQKAGRPGWAVVVESLRP